MSPKQEHVERELLTIGFRTYPRGLANGFVFGVFTAVWMSAHLPKLFLVTWIFAMGVLQLVRLALARAFLRRIQPASSFPQWTRMAAAGYGAVGLAWGVLGAAAIHFAFEEKIYILWVGFLIVIFAVLQSQTTGNKPLILRSFVLGAGTPLIVISAIEPSPNYVLRLVAEFLVLGIALLAGRAGNRNAAESIAVRYENLELLQELTRQKEALDRANIAKSRFLAAASHDLRQPMQAVVLLVENLQERVRKPELRVIVDNISRSVTAMSSLLNEILDISRFEAGAVKPQRTSVPIEEVLQRLRTSFAEPAARKGLRLSIRASKAVVDSDPILLYRMVANLVANAIRYTSRGGVVVGCRPRMDGLLIEVWDSGIGIGPAQIHEIFREFYQVDNPQRDREHGLGLGLAIVERTARVLEHPIAVRSRLGRGSVFSVLVRYGDPSKVQPVAQAAAFLPLSGCNVLVVEDSREIRDAMTVLLEGWGCHVLSALSGAEGEARARAAPELHAIIADYNLPGGDNGISVLRRLGAHHARAARVLMSGDIGPEVIRAAEEAGIPLMHKPLKPARLRALLGSVMRESVAPAPA